MTISKSDNEEHPNFRKVYTLANEIIVCSSIMDNFPFRVKALVKEQTDISLCSYEKVNVKYGLDIGRFGSKSSVLMEMNGAYIIFYNQSEVTCRVRFSILHELGHYLLGHTCNLSTDDPLYSVQEIEANCFAAQLLMPEQLLRECVKRGTPLLEEFIIQSFNVSREAAQKRKNTIAKTNAEWRSRQEVEFDDVIIYKFKHFLDSIAPESSIFSYNSEDEYEKEKERSLWLGDRIIR